MDIGTGYPLLESEPPRNCRFWNWNRLKRFRFWFLKLWNRLKRFRFQFSYFWNHYSWVPVETANTYAGQERARVQYFSVQITFCLKKLRERKAESPPLMLSSTTSPNVYLQI
ncbi:unnamed protein product [Lactuca saligna]|uniref:Uncharacterized protein n=1 Tax=Lactuca saligna TaxID=75948 RepID=A0AA35Z4Q9_LACSI|nr:unnamed protein product [Lactuca saligna]